jgi:hypothetical protein
MDDRRRHLVGTSWRYRIRLTGPLAAQLIQPDRADDAHKQSRGREPPRFIVTRAGRSLVAGLDDLAALDDAGDVEDHREALHFRVVVALGLGGSVVDLLVDGLVVRDLRLAVDLEGQARGGVAVLERGLRVLRDALQEAAVRGAHPDGDLVVAEGLRGAEEPERGLPVRAGRGPDNRHAVRERVVDRRLHVVVELDGHAESSPLCSVGRRGTVDSTAHPGKRLPALR